MWKNWTSSISFWLLQLVKDALFCSLRVRRIAILGGSCSQQMAALAFRPPSPQNIPWQLRWCPQAKALPCFCVCKCPGLRFMQRSSSQWFLTVGTGMLFSSVCISLYSPSWARQSFSCSCCQPRSSRRDLMPSCVQESHQVLPVLFTQERLCPVPVTQTRHQKDKGSLPVSHQWPAYLHLAGESVPHDTGPVAHQAHADQERDALTPQVPILSASWRAAHSFRLLTQPHWSPAHVTAPAWRSVAPGRWGAWRKVLLLRCGDFQV